MNVLKCLHAAILFGTIITATACSKEESEKTQDLLLEKQELTLTEDEKAKVSFKGGEAPFTVGVEDKEKATAKIIDNTVEVTAVKEGITRVFVGDARNRKVYLKVIIAKSIPELVLSKSSFSLTVGKKELVEFSVKGSGEYQIGSSAPTVASATVLENGVEVTAVGQGKATITVTDKVTKKEARIEVDAAYSELSLARYTLMQKIGESTSIVIGGGSGLYEISHDNAGVAKAEINGNQVRISALKKGSDKITITDKNSKKSVSITVTVVEDLALSESSLTIEQDVKETVTVTGGSDGDLQYAVSPENIVEVSIMGRKVVVTGKNTGSATVTITDKENSASKKLTVTVTNRTPHITTKFTNLNVKLSDIGQKYFPIRSLLSNLGSGSYDLEYAPEGIVKTLVNTNGIIYIEALKVGTTQVTITDKNNKSSVKITINVQN